MTLPDWQLPPGVTRSLWEFANDPAIARDEDQHLSDSPLLDFDQQILRRWLTTPGDLLDLGCGTGRHLVELVRLGWRCTGVDLSIESLRVAQERTIAAGLEVKLVRGNLCDLSFLPENSFDAALLLFGTLGMVSGAACRQAVLRQVHDLLRPSGYLVLHVHNLWRHAASPAGRRWLLRDLSKRLRGNPTAGDSQYDYRGIPRMYHHSFTRSEIKRALTEANLHVVEMIPLAPSSDDTTARGDEMWLGLRGPFVNFRATGWLILAAVTKN